AFRLGPQFNRLVGIDEIESRYYLRMELFDQPGVVGQIATILGRYGISISSCVQHEGQAVDHVPMIIITHLAREGKVREAIAEFEKLPVVCGKVVLYRIEEV
ncbi:MAG: ACT domain-containing protein, partial [Victivallales bacterium]|nr:ACT domain-containing protein [Victivallales bacterium]